MLLHVLVRCIGPRRRPLRPRHDPQRHRRAVALAGLPLPSRVDPTVTHALPPLFLDVHLDVEEVVVKAGLPALLRPPLPRVVADRVDDLAPQEVGRRDVVHDEVGEQPDEREVDLRQGDKEPDDGHDDSVARVDLDDHHTHPLGVRNIHRLVVLDCIQNNRRHAVARKRRDRGAQESVDRDAPPLAPRVERDAEEPRVVVGAK